jgi:hypothetical protein
MVTNATALRRSAQTDPTTAWQLVVRTAVAGSLVMMAMAFALHSFVKLSDGAIVAVIAVLGLVIGSRLPAATPPIPHWLLDEADSDPLAS